MSKKSLNVIKKMIDPNVIVCYIINCATLTISKSIVASLRITMSMYLFLSLRELRLSIGRLWMSF